MSKCWSETKQLSAVNEEAQLRWNSGRRKGNGQRIQNRPSSNQKLKVDPNNVRQNSVEAQHQEFIRHIFAASGKRLVFVSALEKKKGKNMFVANLSGEDRKESEGTWGLPPFFTIYGNFRIDDIANYVRSFCVESNNLLLEGTQQVSYEARGYISTGFFASLRAPRRGRVGCD
jgi:hypothetical protein